MLMKIERREQRDPDEILTGVCGTCKKQIEVKRSETTTASNPYGRVTQMPGVWYDAPYVECPYCKEESRKMRAKASGNKDARGDGPRVFLTLKK